jgi:hypothetical protein
MWVFVHGHILAATSNTPYSYCYLCTRRWFSSIQPFTGEHKTTIVLSSGLVSGMAIWASSYSIFYTYTCVTDRCNSWTNMRTMMNATTIKFNYKLVMTELYEPASSGTVIPCLLYSNSTSSCDCSAYPAASLFPCKTCNIQTCDKYFCAGCSSNSSSLTY